MAQINFRNLVPGKRYKIIIKPNTVYGLLNAFPSIDFIVPEAPPRARNFRLTVNTIFKTKTLKKNRKLKIYKYKIENPTGAQAIVVLSTSPLSAKKKNKVKPGDRITVDCKSSTGGNINPDSINITNAVALSRKNKNRIRYYHSEETTPAKGWTDYIHDNGNVNKSIYPITHLNSTTVTVKKAKYVRIRIPKPILQNLTWNDEVKDFVFIVYRKGKKRSRLRTMHRYLWDTDTNKLEVLNSTPPALFESGVVISDKNIVTPTNQINLSDFADGHPAVFIKEITDDKVYEFKFIVARYIKTTAIDPATGNSISTWTGYWIERNTPFLKKLSRPRGWKNK